MLWELASGQVGSQLIEPALIDVVGGVCVVVVAGGPIGSTQRAADRRTDRQTKCVRVRGN